MGRYDALYQATPSPAQPVAGPVSVAPTRGEKVPAHRAVQPIPTAGRVPVRAHRSVEPNDRTDTATATLLDEIAGGPPDHRRPTERYSFEIYIDQKPAIEELQYRFRKRTGTKLSSSRIIREAIAAYLPEALRAVAISNRPQATGDAESSER